MNGYLAVAYLFVGCAFLAYALLIQWRVRRFQREADWLKVHVEGPVPSRKPGQTIKIRNMPITEALFSFKGRMCVSDYWLKGVLPLWPAGFVADLLIFGGGTTETVRTIAIGISIIGLWPLLALVVKRLHDLNRSLWFLLVTLIPLVGTIWFLAEISFLRGTVGPNPYGEDPLQDID